MRHPGCLQSSDDISLLLRGDHNVTTLSNNFERSGPEVVQPGGVQLTEDGEMLLRRWRRADHNISRIFRGTGRDRGQRDEYQEELGRRHGAELSVKI